MVSGRKKTLPWKEGFAYTSGIKKHLQEIVIYIFQFFAFKLKTFYKVKKERKTNLFNPIDNMSIAQNSDVIGKGNVLPPAKMFSSGNLATNGERFDPNFWNYSKANKLNKEPNSTYQRRHIRHLGWVEIWKWRERKFGIIITKFEEFFFGETQ